MFYKRLTSASGRVSTFDTADRFRSTYLVHLNKTIMKNVNYLVLGILLSISNLSFAQQKFTNCSAAFLDNKIVVNEYTTIGKCTLPATSNGKLTVCTAELSAKESKAVEKIPFKIAIRDKKTQTLTSFSDKTFKEIDIQNILKKCGKGDHIILMTTDNQYALPHNEILVM